MTTPRKAIMAALFARFTTLSPFVTVGRRVKPWSQVASVDQPALFQAEGAQERKVMPNAGAKDTLKVEVTVYAHQANTDNRAGDGDLTDLLNDCIDAVIAALDPGPAFSVQTLGGLVSDCRVEGTIETDEGLLGDQAVAVIPIVIVATA